MKNIKQSNVGNRHTDIQQEPARVAARMEGVVKNVGTTAHKKISKLKKSNEGE